MPNNSITIQFLLISFLFPVIWALFGKIIDKNIKRFKIFHWLFITLVIVFLVPIFILDGLKAIMGMIIFLIIGLPLRYYVEKRKFLK